MSDKPTYHDIYNYRAEQWKTHQYRMVYWSDFDYSCLDSIMYIITKGRQKNRKTVNNIIIMADTETSKKPDSEQNHVVCWTISLRAFGTNIATLYGRKPSEFVTCVTNIHGAMHGDKTHIYFHNLSYDWVFLRKFFFGVWGYPCRMLATKPHYPINIEFENGIVIRDSLILAQRKLEKWADDLEVEHRKETGKWDYDKLRNQDTELSQDELDYIENDTLAGVECIDLTLSNLGKDISTIPFTATGIPREQVRKLSRANRGKELFNRQCLSLPHYIFGETVYHGGYVHANRDEIGYINPATCYDFCSSYPYCMLAYKYPMERFMELGTMQAESIIQLMNDYAFMLTLVLVNPDIKDEHIVMPALQFSKCTKSINAILDNGRVLRADYVSINITEMDLAVILEQYTYTDIRCINVKSAHKRYLPRWYTDYVFQCFTDKTMQKGGDPVAYNIAKAKVNCLYGNLVQKSIPNDIVEDYENGNYIYIEGNPEEKYEQYLKNWNNVLCYQWGIWVTAYAFYNLFQLGKCVDYAHGGIWLYSDTDSCYATKWDTNKVAQYNQSCKDKLSANGYGAVIRDGKEYWLGVAELDGVYSEFCALGAKRYCCRYAESGKLKITVAGVPKSGAKCLDDDITNFKDDFKFSGTVTGKLEHKYLFVDSIYIDDNGNETGDSVDLSPCDYTLESVNVVDWKNLDEQEIFLQVYD